MDPNLLISVATIIHNDADIVLHYLEETSGVLDENFKHYEILLVDNGSTDNSVALVKEVIGRYNSIRLLILSKENDGEIAFTAALENSIGDYVVLIDIRTDPPQMIPEMVDRCALGYDYVIAKRATGKEDPFFYRILSWLFHKCINFFTHQKLEMDWSNYVCFSRRLVNAIIQIKDRVRYLKYLKTEVGFSHQAVPYNPKPRAEKKQTRTFWKRLSWSMETIVSNTDRLIRIATLLAFITSLANFLFIFYALGVKLFMSGVAKGWTSTSIIIATMFGVLFLILSIFGEYISVVYKETKKGPLYHIADEVTGSLMFDKFDQKNVT
jgi:glycosyltransferase involved in cell wall biosynthesis